MRFHIKRAKTDVLKHLYAYNSQFYVFYTL